MKIFFLSLFLFPFCLAFAHAAEACVVYQCTANSSDSQRYMARSYDYDEAYGMAQAQCEDAVQGTGAYCLDAVTCLSINKEPNSQGQCN